MPTPCGTKARTAAAASQRETPLPPAEPFLEELIDSCLIHFEDWETLPAPSREELLGSPDNEATLARLVEAGLLTEHQAKRIGAGKTFGLVLGNYRVLDWIGAGGMGVVFRAEHIRMRRPVAIKVLPLYGHEDERLLLRFFTEMRSVAQLHHPNIVGAIDAGEVASTEPDGPVLHYFVMEYVAGRDLEEWILSDGPLAVSQACDLVYQMASALGEAHEHGLVHRDIKPSNVLVTPDLQAKLLDFGLARQFRYRLTEPGTLIGTIDYMAPEQMKDAGSVDIRADIYGLGGTLFWALAGRTPFLPGQNVSEDLARRLTQPPPSARLLRPEIPADLDAIVARMMAVDPKDRYPTPQAVMQALLPFCRAESRIALLTAGCVAAAPAPARRQEAAFGTPGLHKVLIVDDEPDIRVLCRCGLQTERLECAEAGGGVEALHAVREKDYDLVLLDIDMPDLSGLEVLKQLRETPPGPHLKVIMFSGRVNSDQMAQMLLAGADDFLGKPFSLVQLQARVQAALRLKEVQERSDLLNRKLLAVNAELEKSVTSRDGDLVQARNALVLAMAKLVEQRDLETGAHLVRLQRYCRCLAEGATRLPTFAGQIDANFIQMLEWCAPLHDIGNVGLPDYILRKPGKLSSEERLIMQTHTTLGADTLAEVSRQHGFALAFLQMAADIARHHHERWDGMGYPDRLAGSDIPLAARILTLGDVYDALRSRRVYKPSLSHAAVLQIMSEAQGQFDPVLLQVFQQCGDRMDQIFRELAD